LLFFFIFFQQLFSQENFELLNYENFKARQIDSLVWMNKFPWGRTVLGLGKEYYTDGKNFIFRDSMLTINLRRANIKVLVDSSKAASQIMDDGKPNLRLFQYTSGMLCSKEKFLYGKFEMKCRLTKGRGTWPAFWLWGGDEIDIFEKPWKFHRSITTNYHYDSAGIKKQDFRFHHFPGRNAFSKKFHVFTLEWFPDSICWYIDNQLIRKQYHGNNKSMYLIVSLGAAKDKFWGHAPQRRRWNTSMEINYIKIWRLKMHLTSLSAEPEISPIPSRQNATPGGGEKK
jgi:beta-glucanase (GH16 family)